MIIVNLLQILITTNILILKDKINPSGSSVIIVNLLKILNHTKTFWF